MTAATPPEPTERELEILKVLWEQGEGTVRQVHEVLRERLPIVQNTVQAFLRTMEDKGLVEHRAEGRSFIYRAVLQRDSTAQHVLSGVIDRVFDGAMDQLVQSAFSVRKPTREELCQLRALLADAESELEGDGSTPASGAATSGGEA